MWKARRATEIIWKTVVCAGAMLATPGCPSGSTPDVCEPIPEAEITAGEGQPEPTIGEAVAAGEPVTVMVVSNPEGASVFVDDEAEPRGVTPLQLDGSSSDGIMWLRLTREGYRDQRRQLHRDRDYQFAVTLAALTEPAVARTRCRPGRRGRGFILS